MKALSKRNRNLNDRMKATIEEDEMLAKKYQLEGNNLLANGSKERTKALTEMSAEQVDAKGNYAINEAKKFIDTSNSRKVKFLLKHSSDGNRQYQKRIALV